MTTDLLRVMLRNGDIKDRVNKPELYDRCAQLKKFQILDESQIKSAVDLMQMMDLNSDSVDSVDNNANDEII